MKQVEKMFVEKSRGLRDIDTNENEFIRRDEVRGSIETIPGVQRSKPDILLNTPVYIARCILHLTKTIMFQLHCSKDGDRLSFMYTY